VAPTVLAGSALPMPYARCVASDTVTSMETPLETASEEQVESALAVFGAASDAHLTAAIEHLQELQRNRAQSRGDLDALLELGFERGFDASGHALAPFVVQGIVICPGSVVERSANSHECAFVRIGEEWVWESPLTLLDEVRRTQVKNRPNQRSVSLLTATPELELDLIRSKKRQGTHQMQAVISFRLDGEVLTVTSTRAPRVTSHR